MFTNYIININNISLMCGGKGNKGKDTSKQQINQNSTNAYSKPFTQTEEELNTESPKTQSDITDDIIKAIDDICNNTTNTKLFKQQNETYQYTPLTESDSDARIAMYIKILNTINETYPQLFKNITNLYHNNQSNNNIETTKYNKIKLFINHIHDTIFPNIFNIMNKPITNKKKPQTTTQIKTIETKYTMPFNELQKSIKALYLLQQNIYKQPQTEETILEEQKTCNFTNDNQKAQPDQKKEESQNTLEKEQVQQIENMGIELDANSGSKHSSIQTIIINETTEETQHSHNGSKYKSSHRAKSFNQSNPQSENSFNQSNNIYKTNIKDINSLPKSKPENPFIIWLLGGIVCVLAILTGTKMYNNKHNNSTKEDQEEEDNTFKQ